jgi:translation initiation factor 3 subunit A
MNDLLLQDIESDRLSGHLSVLADSLNKARNLINPPAKKPSKLHENFAHLAVVVENEHKRLLARKSIIEKRKEELERQILEKVSSLIILVILINCLFCSFSSHFCTLIQEKEEEMKRLRSIKKTADEEKARLISDQRQREQDRIRREVEQQEKAEAEKKLAEITCRIKGKKKPIIEGVRNSFRLQVASCMLYSLIVLIG